jgi:predicted dehydrogenase
LSLISTGAAGPGGPEFAEFQKATEEKEGIQFFKSVAELPPVAEGKKRLALVSGRTADNPRLLTECIANGCSTVYLEKPGAPTVAELSAMKDEANAAGVTVLMGYNKNVCKYVSKAREYGNSHEGSHITFVSNNAYENTPESLGECFERNSEGMLKNMAIHELALLVSFFDVAVDTIETCVADKEFSSCQTLKGPSGKDYTDFDKIKFTITTKSGKSVSVQANRCGGDVSWASVDIDGKEVFRHSMPDEEDKANVTVLQEEYPGAMPYFFSQDPDYITVKERVASFCANGTEPTGIATIDIAVETLRVAEYLTPTLQEQLSS